MKYKTFRKHQFRQPCLRGQEWAKLGSDRQHGKRVDLL